MVVEQFGRFLLRAMTLPAEECPDAFHELCAQQNGAQIRLTIDSEVVNPSFSESGFALLAEHDAPEVVLESNRDTILAVLDGRLDLESAVWEERVVLRGSLGALAKFHDAFVTCLGGAVRCPSFPKLLERYRNPGNRVPGGSS